MNWKKLKSKYPQIWDDVYEGIINDLKQCLTGAQISEYENGNKNNILERIAHNAAFFACNAVRYRENQQGRGY